MTFPQTVLIPAALRRVAGTSKLIIRNADQNMDAAVIKWMKSDDRYKDWIG